MVDTSQLPSFFVGSPGAVEQRVRQQYGPGGAPVYTLPPQAPSMPVPAAATPAAIQQRISQQYGPGGMLTSPTTFQQPSTVAPPVQTAAKTAPAPAPLPQGALAPPTRGAPGLLNQTPVQQAPVAQPTPHGRMSLQEAQMLLQATPPRITPQEQAGYQYIGYQTGLNERTLAGIQDKYENPDTGFFKSAKSTEDLMALHKARDAELEKQGSAFAELMRFYGITPEQLLYLRNLIKQSQDNSSGAPPPNG